MAGEPWHCDDARPDNHGGIDYNEWKTGKREEDTTYALHSFFRKLAQGVGPSFGLVLMVALGYNEQLGATQPFEVALKMRYSSAESKIEGLIFWIFP